MIKFTINNKKFQGQFYNSIRDNLKQKYSHLYPGAKVEIDYAKKSNIYKFIVFVYMKTISNDNEIIDTKTEVASYDNIIAVNLFSNISMDKYMEEYDDTNKDYATQLNDELNAICIYYKLLGFELEITQNKDNMFIHCPSKNIWSYNNSVIHYFSYDIITKEDKDKCIEHVKSELKKRYKEKK